MVRPRCAPFRCLPRSSGANAAPASNVPVAAGPDVGLNRHRTLHLIMIKNVRQLVLAGVAATAALHAAPALAGKDIDAIKQRGALVCGVNTGLAGFASADSQGKWVGLDVDYCRAVAAALLGDASKVRFVGLTAQQRFTALQSGEIDILSRNTTWTLTRDASLGMTFVGVTFYDGQGFMVPKSLKVTSAKQMKGATVCVQSGTTTELNLADYSRANNLQLKPVVIEKLEASTAAYFSGRCQAYTTDASGLASIRSKEAQKPEDHVILPELISKGRSARPCGVATTTSWRLPSGR